MHSINWSLVLVLGIVVIIIVALIMFGGDLVDDTMDWDGED